jgi:photosystem II stability/assembly factor-like uncharacterized protein
MFERKQKRFSPGLILMLGLAAVTLIFLLNRGEISRRGEHKTNAPALPKDRLPADWFFTMREFPDFTTDLATYDYAMQLASAAAEQRGNFPGFSAPWVTQGPGNIGARVNTIAVHPTNSNIIYIGYSTGGVWKTVNGGQTWLPIFDGQNYMSIGDITLDPSNPNTVYVGTGDLNISGYPFIGDGLWKSTNGGQTWSHLGLTETRVISKVIVHPSDPNTIYVGAMGQPFARDGNRGLFRTKNGGQTWEKVLFVNEQSGVIDMEIDPSSPNILYACVWNRIRNNQESIVSGPDARIWKSYDGGSTWGMLTGGLPQEDYSRCGIALDKLNPQHLSAVYVNTRLQFDAIYETFDSGGTWTKSESSGLDSNLMSNFGWYFGKVFINPFNSNDQWVLGVNGWNTTDGGQSWVEKIGWSTETHVDMHDFAFINASTMLVATDGGLYKTTNSGISWNKLENIPTTQLYRTAYNPHNPDAYYGGAQDNGTLSGNAAGMNQWERLFGGDGFQAAFHPTNPDLFYFEWQNGGIVDGLSSDPATIGIDGNDRRHWDMQYFISPNDAEIMYTGTYRVYLGEGHPPTWSTASDDLTDGVIFGDRFHTISTLSESVVEQSLLYVGTTDGNVWTGNAFTQQWTNITTGLPDRYVSSVKPSPTVPNRVYVTHTGYKDGNQSPMVHRSDNRGSTWTPISGDLPPFAVNDLLVLPGQADSVLFIGTDAGVYGTRNGGQSWARLGVGLPFTPVYDLEFNLEKKELVAASFGRSVLSFPLDSLRLGLDVSTFDPQTANASMTAHPSLFATELNVQLDRIKQSAVTEILVFSMAGQLMHSERVERRGQYQSAISTSHWPNGAYIVTVHTDGKIWSRQKVMKMD